MLCKLLQLWSAHLVLQSIWGSEPRCLVSEQERILTDIPCKAIQLHATHGPDSIFHHVLTTNDSIKIHENLDEISGGRTDYSVDLITFLTYPWEAIVHMIL